MNKILTSPQGGAQFPDFDILKHLDKLTPVEGKSTPNQLEFYCPVCGAENFKVNPKTGKYDAFGCSCNDTKAGKRRVIDAIAPLTWEKPARPARRQTFTYDGLVDGVAENIVQVVRSDDGDGGRKFFQKHWDGYQWATGVPDAVKSQIHLYRIFSKTNEKATGQRIFLVEGEGKVEALLKLGVPATCSIGGAGKWKQYGYPNYLEDLVNYQVVLCPDRDEPGVKHCEEIEADLVANGITVAGWLYAFPDSLLWHRLPKKSGADVADWIAEGATKEDVLASVEPRRVASPPAELASTTGGEFEEDQCALKKRYHRVKKVVGDRLRLNRTKKVMELDGQPLEPELLQVKLAVDFNLQVPDNHFFKIMNFIGEENSYSPVVDYLDQVYKRHGSSTAILDDLSTRYFGTAHPLYNTYIRKTLIAAVARAYQPGCKVDTALILQGRQGGKKSTFFEVLASKDWFDDSFAKSSEKDEVVKLHKVWIVEWAELETVFKRRDVANVKAFLTCKRDVVRPAYARDFKELDRQSIIVGSTNEAEFLADPTGNRRYWVIPVARRIDIDQLQQERDLIWAAAVAAYRAGEAWWLSDEDQSLSNELNQEYMAQDPWANAVEAYLAELLSKEVTTEQILDQCIKLDLEKQDKRAQMRVAGIMKQLGWEQNRRQVNGIRQRVWMPSEDSKNSYFTEKGWAGRAATLEPLKNQEVEPCPTSAQPPDRGWAGRAPNPEKCDSIVCQSAQPARPAQPTNERLGSVEPLPIKGLPDVPDLPDLNAQPFKKSDGLQVGDQVRKVGKTGWRGEVVRLVNDSYVDVLWQGDKHSTQMAIADLALIHESLNGRR
jgi:predicted P-loop ATPase